MIKLDCYMGVESKQVWGINRYKLETFKNITDDRFDKRKISYALPEKPKLLKRLANFFDLFTYSPAATSRHMRKDAIALIMSHSEAYLLNYFKFKKSIVLCYDLLPLQFKLSGWMSRAKLNFAFRGMLKANRIIAVSESVKDDIVNYLGYPSERIDVIYGGVDPLRYKPQKGTFDNLKKKYGIPEEKKVVLFLGSEEHRKNFHVVLRAFAHLKLRFSDVVLLKVGNAGKSGLRERNMRLIHRLGISRDVIFTGYVPEEDTPKLYNLAEVFPFPTLYEGAISLPVIEAMACGCPVISTKYVDETIGDSPAMMKNATDYLELEQMMYDVMTDNSFRDKIIRHGLQESKRFYWSRTGKMVEDALWKLL